MQYEVEVRECFYNLRFCRLEAGKDCWTTHEHCVIDATHKYKTLLQSQGLMK